MRQYIPEMIKTCDINFVAICGILHLVTQSNVTKLGSWLLNQCKYMYSSFCAQNHIIFSIFVRRPKFINLKAPIQKYVSTKLILSCFEYLPQTNLERSDFETKSRLTNQLSSMERELNMVRRKLDGEGEQHRTVLKTWEV